MMKTTWNSTSVTPNPFPSKITVRNLTAIICRAAILYLSTVDWLICYSLHANLYNLSPDPDPYFISAHVLFRGRLITFFDVSLAKI